MSDDIKPLTKVFVFELLEGTTGGGVHIPWLDTAFGPGEALAIRHSSLLDRLLYM